MISRRELVGKRERIDALELLGATFVDIVISLHLVCLLTKLIPHLEKEKVYDVKQAVYEFVMVGAKGRGGSSPLHLACSRETSSVGRRPICNFPSVPTIDLLLEWEAQWKPEIMMEILRFTLPLSTSQPRRESFRAC